ncbi:probable trafficking protein particle complex subunit 13 homolog isoform X1 [Drosophila pseudoobscura]|uniref:Probable trafficking protein particle complex subunit 13 homolog isoform X1 n=1 Tax=Drosophila pseudoobscura pseudoobscura TaxID=46245 RepID=A0A6I8W0R0_DROPS|nr:probable trafficking protein particle complex subunit 13 homolog isoform X1 [Drosophila pseudoobscura]
MDPIEPDAHLLALKVMRLMRPTLVELGPVVSCEHKDLVQRFSSKPHSDVFSGIIAETLSAGQVLLLPQSFGNIYLGETFSSYICVHNCSPQPVECINVKTDLQSNSTRINLSLQKNNKSAIILAPGETIDDVIRYEVKEIGTHILVCEVNYTSPAGYAQSLRKFFKFQVLKPLDVKTKFYNAEIEEIYLEAQIQNVTTSPFCLEKVELDSSEEFTVIPLNTLPNGESVFNTKNMLQPNNSCQFLYCIKPKVQKATDIHALRQLSNVGKLDIVWRSNLGEKGRLQTSQLQRLPYECKDLRFEVINALNTVKIGTIFTFNCRVTNTSEHTMKLHVRLVTKLSPECQYTGCADFKLDELNTGENAEFPLSVSPSKLGLIKIADLLLVDTENNEHYSIEKVVEVFVVDSDYNKDHKTFQNRLIRYAKPTDIIIQSPVQLQVV